MFLFLIFIFQLQLAFESSVLISELILVLYLLFSHLKHYYWNLYSTYNTCIIAIPIPCSSWYSHRDKSVAPHRGQYTHEYTCLPVPQWTFNVCFMKNSPALYWGGVIKNITRQISCTSLLGRNVFSLQQTICLTSKSNVEYQKMMNTNS